MKINIQKLMRVLPSFITVFVIISMCVIPAFAVPTVIDYNDYIVSIEKDGSNDIIKAVIPSDLIYPYWYLYNDKSAIIKDAGGKTFSFDADLSSRYMLDISVLDGSPISLKDIPYGTTMNFSFVVRSSSDFATPISELRYKVWYLDDDGAYVGAYQGSWVPGNIDQNEYQIILNYPTGASQFVIDVFAKWAWPLAGVASYTLELTDISFDISISSALRQEQLTGKTNKLLEEIKEQMNINNQNWQDFLDGKKEWQDIVDSSTDKVEGAVDDMNGVSDSLATVPKPEVDIDTLVPDELAGQEYLNYINVIQQIWSNPLISTVTYIMGCMLIISYLLFGERG